jgi:hypothetical protein
MLKKFHFHFHMKKNKHSDSIFDTFPIHETCWITFIFGILVTALIVILQKTLIVEENKMHSIIFISVMLAGVLALKGVSHISSKNMEISTAIILMYKKIIQTYKRLERDVDYLRIIYSRKVLQFYNFKKHTVSYHHLFIFNFTESIFCSTRYSEGLGSWSI